MSPARLAVSLVLAGAAFPGGSELHRLELPVERQASMAPSNAGADTCDQALHVGSVPPDYLEAGVVVGPEDAEWRSFTLSEHRALRIEAIGAPATTGIYLANVCGIAQCGYSFPSGFTLLARGFGQIETGCLRPRTAPYHVGVYDDSASVGPFSLKITDLGSCLPPGEVLVRSTRIVDLDGDRDGFPDTGETVELFVTLDNRSGTDLTHVVGTLTTSDPRIECISSPLIVIDSLPAHSETEAAQPLRFRVGPTSDRTAAGKTADQAYAAAFTFTLVADPHTFGKDESLTLELDLDAGNPSVATTTFVEGFETGFGAFQFQNLDANRASNALSYGYRCQYSNPARICSGECCNEDPYYLGFAGGQAPVNAWHLHTSLAPDGGRAFAGTRSLHYGMHDPGNPERDTYQLSQLDAMRTKATQPIRLAARICGSDPSPDKRACATDADCVGAGGGSCDPASPELSIKHQVSTVGSRLLTNMPPGEAVDRAVVQVLPTASGVWESAPAIWNVYDAVGTDFFAHPMFDPVDDGNDENSLYDPLDPYALHGPSSTCMPQRIFSYQGDTAGSFDPGNTGGASDGPGLPGDVGPGTWVESRFDLSRYRGRAVSIRFLFTSFKFDDIFTVQDALGTNRPDDDGWYVDDVRVTQTLGASSATVTADDKPPPGPDDDGDGVAACSDCRPANSTIWAAPGDPTSLRVDGQGPTSLTWDPPLAPGGASVRYDVLRSLSAADFRAAACIATDTTSVQALDPDPPPGSAAPYFYLIRSENDCGRSLGTGSSGAPRSGPECP